MVVKEAIFAATKRELWPFVDFFTIYYVEILWKQLLLNRMADFA
jgi:hypothetical protein